MSFSNTKTNNYNIVLSFLKGLIVSMLISFGLVILLAFSLKWFSLSENLISPLNLAIKAISVLVGSCVAVRGESKGLIKGVAFGLIYIFVAFFSFSILANNFSMDASFLLDAVSASLVGGIIGIIKVNKK